MVLRSFKDLLEKVRSNIEVKKVVLASAADEHSLEAIAEVMKKGLVKPVLVGDAGKIKELLSKLSIDIPEEDVYDVPDPSEAAQKAIDLINDGKGDFLMKGKLETSQLLKPVVNKETGLGTGHVMSHFVIQYVPGYHKLFAITDSGMMAYPTVEQKRDIINDTVDTMRALGYEQPKVACVTAVEKENPKMPETLEAAELKKMYLNGEIKNCIIEGPISLDLALDKNVAKIKGYESPVAGDADILVVPNIHVGNILGKSITILARGGMAGFIVGAKVPIVLTSRASSAEEKFYSIILAAAASAGKR